MSQGRIMGEQTQEPFATTNWRSGTAGRSKRHTVWQIAEIIGAEYLGSSSRPSIPGPPFTPPRAGYSPASLSPSASFFRLSMTGRSIGTLIEGRNSRCQIARGFVGSKMANSPKQHRVVGSKNFLRNRVPLAQHQFAFGQPRMRWFPFPLFSESTPYSRPPWRWL